MPITGATGRSIESLREARMDNVFIHKLPVLLHVVINTSIRNLCNYDNTLVITDGGPLFGHLNRVKNVFAL